jgi:hypothetical protein
MQNGYVLAHKQELDIISGQLKSLTPEQIDTLRGKLRIGIHRDVEVTEGSYPNKLFVSQAFCSALPVAYSGVEARHWEPFATFILEAAYEATMWAAVENAERAGSKVVFLTLLGGGAFGNNENWIYAAIQRAIGITASFDLDVRLVSYGTPPIGMTTLLKNFK